MWADRDPGMLDVSSRIKSDEADPDAVALWRDKKFRMFVYAVAGAYSGILIRCIYRYESLSLFLSLYVRAVGRVAWVSGMIREERW